VTEEDLESACRGAILNATLSVALDAGVALKAGKVVLGVGRSVLHGRALRAAVGVTTSGAVQDAWFHRQLELGNQFAARSDAFGALASFNTTAPVTLARQAASPAASVAGFLMSLTPVVSSIKDIVTAGKTCFGG
jgi:hypothetical protein